MDAKRLLPMVVACALVVPAPAGAITNGAPDDGRHPYVGGLVSHDGRDRKRHLICTGTLIAPNAFLTAAHCLVGEPTSLYVSFDAFVGAPDVGPEVVLHPGKAFMHPQFVDETAPGDTHDIAVIKLDPPVTGIEPATLPLEGSLDELHASGATASSRYGLAGYGREGKSGNKFYGGGTRRFALGGFLTLEPFKLNLDQRGTLGGTCNGDSGGPAFIGEGRTVMALVSDGDPDCAISSVNYRIDTASARAFLADHVELPASPAPPGPPAPSPVPGGAAAPKVSAVVTTGFAASRRGTRVRRFRVDRLPSLARLELRCRAPRASRRRCPFRLLRASGGPTKVLTRAFARRRLPVGAVLQLRITAPGAMGRVIRWSVTARRLHRSAGCLPPNSLKRITCPETPDAGRPPLF